MIWLFWAIAYLAIISQPATVATVILACCWMAGTVWICMDAQRAMIRWGRKIRVK